MDKKGFLISICILACFFISTKSFSQQKLLIQTKQNISELSLYNIKTGKVTYVHAINNSGNLFYIETKQPIDYSITAASPIEIKVINLKKKQTGKWITVKPDERLNLLLSTSENNTKVPFWYKLSGKLTSGLVYNSVTCKPNGSEHFFFGKSFSFLSPDEFELKWSDEYITDSLKITSIENENCIWQTKTYPKNKIDYTTLKNSLNQDFERNKMYHFTVYAKNSTTNTNISYQTTFTFSSLVFTNKNPAYFIINDSIEVNWRTKQAIHRIFIRDTKNKNIIWEKDEFPNNNLNFASIKNEFITALETRKKYEIIIELDNNSNTFERYTMNFEILLSKSEYFKIVEFLDKEE